MHESSPNPNLPSGYVRVEHLQAPVTINDETLPWLQGDYDLAVAQCELQDGTNFYLASAVGTHDKLVTAAEAMNDHQQRSVNNMFYSRIASFITDGHSPQIETTSGPSTPFPIKVMRNKSGQRVYFGVINASIGAEQNGQESSVVPIVLRLGVCDKNKQAMVMSVLSGQSAKSSRRKAAKE